MKHYMHSVVVTLYFIREQAPDSHTKHLKMTVDVLRSSEESIRQSSDAFSLTS